MTGFWAGGLAFMLGALHALEPGHGKAAIAAYTVGHRGRLGHVLVLGLSTALAHTATIIVLALMLGVAAGDGEHVHHWFEYASAALLVGVGCWMLVRARRRSRSSSSNDSTTGDHAGDAADDCGCGTHEATHAARNDAPGYRLAGVMGLTGGIIPCPSALAALLSAAAVGHFAYGVWSVILFSTVIAVTLSLVALFAHYAAKSSRSVLPAFIGNQIAERLSRHAPAFSAVLVMLCGIYSLCRVVWQGH